jgi:hypothetical protein
MRPRFNTWKLVYDSGVRAIVRGEQAFGSKASRSERSVRRNGGWPWRSDYPSGILKTLRTNVTGTAMDHNRLAFRILIVARIRQLLMDDSLIR